MIKINKEIGFELGDVVDINGQRYMLTGESGEYLLGEDYNDKLKKTVMI